MWFSILQFHNEIRLLLTQISSKDQIKECRELIKEHDPFGNDANKICAGAMIWCSEHCSETLYADAEVSCIVNLFRPCLLFVDSQRKIWFVYFHIILSTF